MTIPIADLPSMQDWAASIMAARGPDFIIGDNYLRRWWVIPRNPFCNVYLHEILVSDDDRALHDHPWANTSFVIEGRYFEHTPDFPTTYSQTGRGPLSRIERKAGDVVTREATALHRLEVLPGERAVSLFITGPQIREWGFLCPQGWRHWTEFVDARDKGAIGRGCD